MIVVACNRCGGTIGDYELSNTVPEIKFQIKNQKSQHKHTLIFQAQVPRGFDCTKVHYCQKCLTQELIDNLQARVLAMS